MPSPNGSKRMGCARCNGSINTIGMRNEWDKIDRRIAGTMEKYGIWLLPLVLLPDVCFTAFPYALTLEGQYIIKNLVLIAAALVVGGTVRHRKLKEKLE